MRDMELRRREGSRRAAASHFRAKPTAECIGRADGLVHSAKRDRNRCSRSAAATPRACEQWRALPHRRCELVGRARRRSFCSRCTWLVPQASIPAAEGACTHAMLAHHTVLTCVLASCARRRWKGSGADIQWIPLTVHAVGSCIGWWSILVCNYLQQDAARDA